MTTRSAAAVVVLALTIGACSPDDGGEVACGSGGAEPQRYFLLDDPAWELRGADGAPDGDLVQPDVDWYTEHERSVPPAPGALASTVTLNVSGHESGVEEQMTQLAAHTGPLGFTETEVGGRRARVTATGGRSSVSVMYLHITDDYTVRLLSTEAGPDTLVEAAAELDAVCQDEWFDEIEADRT